MTCRSFIWPTCCYGFDDVGLVLRSRPDVLESLWQRQRWGLCVGGYIAVSFTANYCYSRVQCSRGHACCSSSVLLYVLRGPGPPPRRSHSSEWLWLVQCCCTSSETVRTIRDGEPRTSTSTFTQLWVTLASSVLLYVHKDHKANKDREPRTATSTFTQLLRSE